jgi:hypothetical protein
LVKQKVAGGREGHRGHFVWKRKGLLTGINNDALLRLEILASEVKPFLEFRRQTSLDLYCPRFLAWRGQQEIDFSAGRCVR